MFEVVKLFIEYGADVNLKNIGNETAIIQAYDKRHKEIVEFLIKNGAENVTIQSKKSWCKWNYMRDITTKTPMQSTKKPNKLRECTI